MRSLPLAAALIVLLPTLVAAQKSDHPMLTGYPGATITKKDVRDFDEQSCAYRRVELVKQ